MRRNGAGVTRHNGAVVIRRNGAVAIRRNGAVVTRHNGAVVTRRNGAVVIRRNGAGVIRRNGAGVIRRNGAVVTRRNGAGVIRRNGVFKSPIHHRAVIRCAEFDNYPAVKICGYGIKLGLCCAYDLFHRYSPFTFLLSRAFLRSEYLRPLSARLHCRSSS